MDAEPNEEEDDARTQLKKESESMSRRTAQACRCQLLVGSGSDSGRPFSREAKTPANRQEGRLKLKTSVVGFSLSCEEFYIWDDSQDDWKYVAQEWRDAYDKAIADNNGCGRGSWSAATAAHLRPPSDGRRDHRIAQEV
jgi:hypothetical protein